MNQSEQINELITALSKAQSQIQPALKDSVNPFFKSKYADLSSIWHACKDPLTQNGLAVLQTMDHSNGQLLLVTTLAHSSGQWMRSTLPIISTRQDAQSLGSAITYMRRYSLAAMVGVTSDEDDDGNMATQATKPNVSKSLPAKEEKPVSEEECEHLEILLDKCSASYAANIRRFYENKGIYSFCELNRNAFNLLKKKISENLWGVEGANV